MYETRPVRSLRMEPLLEEVLFLIGPPDSGLRPDLPKSFAQVAALKLFLPLPFQPITQRCRSMVQTASSVKVYDLRMSRSIALQKPPIFMQTRLAILLRRLVLTPISSWALAWPTFTGAHLNA